MLHDCPGDSHRLCNILIDMKQKCAPPCIHDHSKRRGGDKKLWWWHMYQHTMLTNSKHQDTFFNLSSSVMSNSGLQFKGSEFFAFDLKVSRPYHPLPTDLLLSWQHYQPAVCPVIVKFPCQSSGKSLAVPDYYPGHRRLEEHTIDQKDFFLLFLSSVLEIKVWGFHECVSRWTKNTVQPVNMEMELDLVMSERHQFW